MDNVQKIDPTFEFNGRTYNAEDYLFLVPVIYDGEIKDTDLPEPDHELHFFPKAAAEAKKGKKILLFDRFPSEYLHPARKADPSRLMHIRTVVQRKTGTECLALFVHLSMLMKAYRPLHIGVITFEEAVQFAKEFGTLVIDPGFVNRMIRVTEDEPQETEKKTESMNDMLCGTLVAKYKKTHDRMYSEEYVRRLVSIGFTDAEANNLFMLELMILKSVNTDVLADSGYLYKPCFPAQGPVLTQEDSWYIGHQMFLVSEITKMFDEAEYIWRTYPGTLTDPQRKDRIYRLTRYGGGKLYIDYLQMIADSSHTDLDKIRTYSMKELDLLYKYRWERAEIPYPYISGQKEIPNDAPVSVTIHSYGNGKITAIKYIRMISGCSLAEAKAVSESLPQKIRGTVPMGQALQYKQEMEKEGAVVSITAA